MENLENSENCPRCDELIIFPEEVSDGEKVCCPNCGLELDLSVDDDGDVYFGYEE